MPYNAKGRALWRHTSRLAISGLILSSSSQSKERTGYRTQKPTALLERIIKASSKKDDVVLDPFCGCATTCIAAEKTGRNWIGIDISHEAYRLVNERLAREVPEDLFRGKPNYETEPPERSKRSVAEKGWVYVFRLPLDEFAGLFKVGISRNNPEGRVAQGITYLPPGKEPIMMFKHQTPYFMACEKYIHKKYGVGREWVKADISTLEEEIKQYKE